MNLRFFQKIGLSMMIGTSLFLGGAPVQAAGSEETIKAALLFNIMKFVKWPSSGSLKVCAVGSSGMASALEQKLKGQNINGQSVSFAVTSAASAAACQVAIFEGGSVPGNFKSLPVLTVGNGGIVSFSVAVGKVQFSLDQTTAKKNNLGISAQLLKLAKSVY
ncbi:hypothetical protein COW36_24780 [bacterium (Candidatus Blackallbacteria) CG17_big_fil_post_rev_8_21_14_2_50_48_46]|uniref:DUF4154 domain-containing protein n=1 Tax=bacterium (Candidatus Blackallbacteria) CG17_big_fil_post_rev_8_21_14_2_50_48_46 TaxID=2014261 RepID=A0A2M7FXD5_9BACT|nr:MAG: hypothetical protein COW64_19720 [bacterium (Candidatus Blackallbacteria) CG18_big_fil_WC_8_21_14_2_50_49_26]PIW13884.1 MAG: hypothetical protein COW36_24780 [bacterium (Candidatus Blackallbacteria) CG17_big_fil_post_rev_8_21_14_2_50_48_46]PIW45110.1 MAG: hypothetical protein COW20_22410 [bacterium (Candidatus Blackallbacteria) CG13_big_fil_rev_8_21_14_2_50_49_14]